MLERMEDGSSFRFPHSQLLSLFVCTHFQPLLVAGAIACQIRVRNFTPHNTSQPARFIKMATDHGVLPTHKRSSISFLMCVS